MATLVRDIERPAFLDRPVEEQLPLGGTVAPREVPTGHIANAMCGASPIPLSARLRSEQVTSATASTRTRTARGGEATLDELFVGAWEGLSACRPVTCPVCAGPMHPCARADGGACADCGAQLR